VRVVNHFLICTGLLSVSLRAQAASQSPAEGEPSQKKPEWSYSVSSLIYLLPYDGDYAQPTFTADRKWLHLEARYNYENLNTGSAWVGYNFTAGKRLTLEITPMAGAVFGATTGIAPGCHGTLDWRRLELYSESEYVIATDDRTKSFYYNWSQLTLSPVDWLKAGLVVQRTRAYKSDRAVQRGFLVGVSHKHFESAVNLFNLDSRKPSFVISVGVKF
jgi:hypothetical protein